METRIPEASGSKDKVGLGPKSLIGGGGGSRGAEWRNQKSACSTSTREFQVHRIWPPTNPGLVKSRVRTRTGRRLRLGKGGLFTSMRGREGAASVRPIRTKQRSRASRSGRSAKPGAHDSDFSITNKITPSGGYSTFLINSPTWASLSLPQHDVLQHVFAGRATLGIPALRSAAFSVNQAAP